MLFPFSVWRFFSAFTSPVCISFGPASSRTSTWFARGWPLNTLDIRQGVRIRIWHQWNDFTFTDLPWNNLSLPQGVKGQAARLSTHSCRALQAPLGSHFCCFDSQLLLLRLAKMKKIPLQATHGCARDYTQATPAPVGSLSPVPAAMLGGGDSSMKGLWPEPRSITAESWTWGAATCCHGSHHTSAPEVGARQNAEQRGRRKKDAEGKGLALPSTQHGQNDNYCETSQWLIWHYSQCCFWI